MANRLDSHRMAVKRIIHYLKGTMHLGLCATLALVNRQPSLRPFVMLTGQLTLMTGAQPMVLQLILGPI